MGAGPETSFGGDTRRRADLRLVNLTGVGGPIFVAGTRPGSGPAGLERRRHRDEPTEPT